MMNDQQRTPKSDQRRVEVIVRPGPARQTQEQSGYHGTGPTDLRVGTTDEHVVGNGLSDHPARDARREATARRRFTIGKLIDYWWYLIAVLEVFLAARFFFELTGANRAAGFVRFVYGISEPFAWPFNAIFAVPRQAQYVFDPNVIIAMIVYVLIGAGVARLLAMLIEPPSTG